MQSAPRDTTSPSARRRRLRSGCLASALSLLCALGAAELFARWKYGTPLSERRPLVLVRAHPTRGWEMVPNQVHYTYLHEAHVNSLGLRGPELPAQKSGELRVLCLGDSLVYGQGVAEQHTIPAQLEQLLGAELAPRPVLAINAGLRAYSTPQELALLEELGARIAPDVVALFWYYNDLSERDIAQTYANLTRSGPITFDTGAPMEGWTTVEWELKQLARHSALLMRAYDVWKTEGEGPFSREVEDAGYQRLDAYFARFLADARALGARPIVVAVPESSSLRGPSPFDRFTVRMREIAARHALEVVDPLPALCALYQQSKQLPVLPYDGHYEPAANAAMARALAQAIASSLPR